MQGTTNSWTVLDYISTLLMLLVRSYRSTTNRSRRLKHSFEICVGQSVRYKKALVTSGNEVQVSHALLFPRLEKLDTESQPVNAWSIPIARDLEGPNAATISWIWIWWTFFPVPKLIHISSTWMSANDDTAIATTSESNPASGPPTRPKGRQPCHGN